MEMDMDRLHEQLKNIRAKNPARHGVVEPKRVRVRSLREERMWLYAKARALASAARAFKVMEVLDLLIAMDQPKGRLRVRGQKVPGVDQDTALEIWRMHHERDEFGLPPMSVPMIAKQMGLSESAVSKVVARPTGWWTDEMGERHRPPKKDDGDFSYLLE